LKEGILMTRKAKGRMPVGSYRRGTNNTTPKEYATFISELKDRIRVARSKAVLSVNRELIGLYWHIGRSIVERQRNEGWGESIVDRLSTDIQREFPGIKGFSPRNIWRMRAFFLAWTEGRSNLAEPGQEIGNTEQTRPATEVYPAILPQAVAELPWSHNVILIERLNDSSDRLWYAHKTIEHGWSRAVV
jgi:predicted nuclease of restriction endonuclease-like (RecB) superfamily